MKKQFKKGLSLMMAVLMVLSCWVWVAPTKAEAVDADGGDYYIEVDYTSTGGDFSNSFTASSIDRNDDGACCGVAVYYKEVNGTGSETKIHCFDLDNKTASSTMTLKATLSGFPTGLRAVLDCGYFIGAGSDELKVTALRVGPDSSRLTTLWKGEIYCNSSTKYKDAMINYTGSYITYDDGEKTDTNQDNAKVTSTSGYSKWDLPKPTKINGMAGTAELSAPRIGDTSVPLTDVITGTVVDQYNVAWHEGATYTISQTSSDTTGNTGSEESGIWLAEEGDGVRVKVNQNIQTNYLIKDNPDTEEPEMENTFYVVASCVSKSVTASATPSSTTITVKYPLYKWSFKSDEHIVSPDSVVSLSNGKTDKYGTFEREQAYGQSLAVYPTGVATRDGHVFFGFWSNAQPAEKDDAYSNPFASEEAFKMPVSNEALLGMSENERKSYYDGGVQYDPKGKAPTVEGDMTYYGWWLSDDISVKFYDIDGKFLDSFELKYGKTDEDIEWPTPTESFSNGNISYSNWDNRWVNIDGEIIDSDSYTFKHDLILTPKYEDVEANYTYYVTVYDLYGFKEISQAYKYRDTVTHYGEADVAEYPEDEAYSYTFEGWTTTPSKVDGTAGNAVVMIEEGGFDAEGNAIHLVEDFTVRRDIEYYPVYRRHIKSYDVYFSYYNNRAESVTVPVSYEYGAQVTPPADVPSEYATFGAEYKLLGWNKGNTPIDNFYSEYCTGADVMYIARYDGGTATAYNVTFNYFDEDGKPAQQVAQVNHGDFVLQETVDALAPAQNYDNGEELVEFLGLWDYLGTEDTSDDIKTEDLVTFSPENHVTFNAVYGNGKPFHTVTYVDGATEKEYRVVDGAALPTWNVDKLGEDGKPVVDENGVVQQEEYVPTREETLEGYYEFIGWYDENGTQYFPNDEEKTTITGNVTLTPEFEFKLHEYKVTFLNWKGEVLKEKTDFHYGDSLEAFQAEAEALTAREADSVYTYQFLGWDKRVPATCQGADLVFVAQYKSIYIYYDVEWYNGVREDADGKTIITDGKVTFTEVKDGAIVDATKALTTSHYVYGEKLHTPSVSLTVPTSQTAGEVYVFAGWYYIDANGEEQLFSRGLEIAGDMQMYAKYKLAPKEYTVTVITTEATADTEAVQYEVVVAEGDKLSITNPPSGFVDANNHNEFTHWTDEDGNVFNLDTPITGNITITANYNVSTHDYTMFEVLQVPTYPEDAYFDYDGTEVPASTGKGVKEVWCACSRKDTKKEEPIDALKDTIAPTGTSYVGTTRWDDYDSAEAAATVFAGPRTDIIITTTDIGGTTTCTCLPLDDELCPDCQYKADYNPTNKGSGVKYIYSYTAKSDVEVDVTDANIWVRDIYNWATIKNSLIGYYQGWDNVPLMYKEYNANVTSKAGILNLENGSEYITYFKLVDKLGNASYMRTGKYVYDNATPVVSLAGDHNSNSSKFCKTVTVTVADDNFESVTVNGEAKTLTDGKLVISEAGLYQIVAADKAGNKTTVSVEVLADHETRVNKVEATCEQGGYESEICNICNKEVGQTGATPALGHKEVTKNVPATCTENGYDLTYCERCGVEIAKVEFAADGTTALYPAGHVYEYDVDDTSTWKVAKEATCSKTGKLVNPCKNCDVVLEEVIATNDNHSFYNPVTVRPTCTEGGQKTKTCRYCGETVTIETYAAKGHTAAEDFKVVTKATCYSDGEQIKYCAVCKVEIPSTAEGTEGYYDTVIPATNAHKWVFVETVTDPADGKLYDVYGCSNDGCPATRRKEADVLEEYTVTFNGTVIAEETDETTGETVTVEKAYALPITVVEGSTITEEDVAAQAKLDSEDGVYEYTFAGWFDEAQTSADFTATNGEKYALPMNVSKDITLYAQFTRSKIVYTVNFEVPTVYNEETGKFSGNERVKSLMGTIGDKRTPAETPSFKETSIYSYEFIGWAKKGVATGAPVTKTVVIDGEGTYVAKFEVSQKEYAVIFMNGTDYLYDTSVDAGETAVYAGPAPTKAYDSDNHYTFNGWDKSLTNITAKTTVYAQYTATAHTLKETGTVVQTATCNQPELTKFECTAECGYTETKQTAPKLNHVAGEPETIDGKTVVKCTLCGTELSSIDATYTIKFENWNGNRLGTLTIKVDGTEEERKIVYNGATPTKPSDDVYSYKFAGWVLESEKDDESATVYGTEENPLPVATESVTYVAKFDKVDRVYSVKFATKNNIVVAEITGVKYGEGVEFTYADFVAAADAKGILKSEYENEADSKGHWSFTEWDASIESITGDTYVRPVFEQAAHTYTDSTTGATCEEAGGVKHSCDCGYYYIDGNVPAKGHNWGDPVVTAPDYVNGINGKRVYTCLNGCGETKTEEISGQLTEIKVTVKDQNGKPVENALVRLYAKDAEGNYSDTGLNDRTKADGVVVFYVQPGEYRVYISVDGMEDTWYDIVVEEDGTTTGSKDEVVVEKPSSGNSGCGCSCHKNNFWGAFFRFFQKIIKLFTGEPSCCADPDSRI